VFAAFEFQDVVYLLSLFVSLTPKVCALPTVSRASATINKIVKDFNKERQLLGLSQFFEVNDMQDDFSWWSPRVSGAGKSK
jgi:hypothetical protein